MLQSQLRRIGSAPRHGRFRIGLPPRRDCGALSGGASDRPAVPDQRPGGRQYRSQKADRIATEIFNAIHDNGATKQDLQQLEQRMLLRIAELDAKVDRVVVRLDSLMVVLLGLLFAAPHYWPPHG
jgi:hypothetical protein